MIERHIEKIVLGVCALILVYAVFYWALGSPREIEVVSGGHGRTITVGPGEVDSTLAKAAREIEVEIDQTVPQHYSLDDYNAQLAQRQDRPFSATELVSLGQPSAPLRPSGLSDEDQERVKLADIIKAMPAPSMPLINVGREYPRREGQPPADMLVTHVVATYDRAELIRKWNETLKNTRIWPRVVAVAVKAEVRERRLDGTWSSSRPVRMTRIPLTDAAGNPISPPMAPDFDGNNHNEINAAIEAVGDLSWQREILEPEFWDIWSPTGEWVSWRTHLPDNPVSKEYRKQIEPKTTAPPHSARRTLPVPRKPPARRTTPRRTIRPTSPPRGGAMPDEMSGVPPEQLDPAVMAEMMRRAREEQGAGGQPAPGRRPRARTPAPRPTAPKRVRPVMPRTPVRQPGAGREFPRPEETPVPPLADQMETGTVLVWFHDAGLESLKTYQYRIRLVFVNPLLTRTREVENPEDARGAHVETPWSDWSHPVAVPQETEFFVTRHSTVLGMVYVDVFARALGQWVRRSFGVSEGELIGQEKDVNVPDPTNGAIVKQTVDFSTGAVVVRLDFTKTVRTGTIDRPTVEMVYLNEKGQLRTRIRAIDENSKRYKHLKEEAARAKAVAAGRAERP